MSNSDHTSSEAYHLEHSAMEQPSGSVRLAPVPHFRMPRVLDPTWAPRHATVGMVGDDREATQVYQLRYQVYVHEQGKRPDGVDWQRSELVDPLDAWSCLWYARNGRSIVGTVAQTIIGPGFDLGRLPSAMDLDGFPRSLASPLGYSSRFAIAPDHRSSWVLPSLARYSYAHGRDLGAKFDFMATNPGLVPLFERLGYVRYTTSAVHARDVGLLIPMVLAATDHEHLRNVRSACLPAAAHFAAEPEWGTWLRAAHPIIDYYYGDLRPELRGASLARRTHLPVNVAIELSSMSFVHHFPAGTVLLREGDRATCTFVAMDGHLSVTHANGGAASTGCAPDGVPLSRAAIRCETDAVVLCVPVAAVVRLNRRHAEHAGRVQEWLDHAASGDVADAQTSIPLGEPSGRV